MKNIKKIKNHIKCIKNTISLILFSISYYLYYLSLEKCFYGVDDCGNRMPWIMKKVYQLAAACVISSFLFFLILINQISKIHIIHFVLVFIYFYQISHSYYFFDHGLFNIIGFFILFFLIVISLIIIRLINILIITYYLSYKFRKILVIVLLLVLYYNSINPMNCDDWGNGLNNTSIENDVNKYGCQIEYPKRCSYKLFQYFQDLTKLTNMNCSNKNKDYKKIIFKKSKSPYITNNTKIFGFPLTKTRFEGRLDGGENIVRKFVLDNIFDMENNTRNISEQPELILDFSKSNLGEYIIDMKFNKTLSKERKKLENKISPYSENIFILFIDSVSRGNSIRQMKKTLKFFEKFMPYNGGYNPKYPNENFHSFQYFKYQSFRFHTSGNFPRIFYGNRRESKKKTLLTKYFKENGYVTMYGSETCQKENSKTLHNFTDSELYDHQFLICDPNKVYYTAPYIKCLYGKINIDHILNYTDQFWRKYKNNRKLAIIVVDDGHEGTLEALKYSDEIISNYINNLFNDDLFKDSSLILLSDHGVVMPSIYSLYDFYNKEKRLPMLYLLINDRKNMSYEEQYFYLHKNQQTFITAFDIYNTINHLLYGDNYINIRNKTKRKDFPKSPSGESLFNYIDQKKRTPKPYRNMVKFICK